MSARDPNQPLAGIWREATENNLSWAMQLRNEAEADVRAFTENRDKWKNGATTALMEACYQIGLCRGILINDDELREQNGLDKREWTDPLKEGR